MPDGFKVVVGSYFIDDVFLLHTVVTDDSFDSLFLHATTKYLL